MRMRQIKSAHSASPSPSERDGERSPLTDEQKQAAERLLLKLHSRTSAQVQALWTGQVHWSSLHDIPEVPFAAVEKMTTRQKERYLAIVEMVRNRTIK